MSALDENGRRDDVLGVDVSSVVAGAPRVVTALSPRAPSHELRCVVSRGVRVAHSAYGSAAFDSLLDAARRAVLDEIESAVLVSCVAAECCDDC